MSFRTSSFRDCINSCIIKVALYVKAMQHVFPALFYTNMFCDILHPALFFFIFPEHRKYFATPSRQRNSEANENFSCSIPEHASEVVSSRKKPLTHAFASTETVTVSGVTFREHQRPITRSK
jgi:hypothetical protein